MSEEKSKGISLRRKKTSRPTISAPRQISAARDREPSADSRSRNEQWDARSGVSASTTLTVPGGGDGGDGRGRQEKTAELVKRRYSTRFAGGVPIQDPNAPPMPSMPSIPPQFARQQTGASTDGRARSRDGPGRDVSPGGGRLQVDLRALRDPNLQADKYVQTLLSDATETDIRAYVSELQNVKDNASNELQHSVYQNRTQFIKISKEADKLKSEMHTLRALMSDLTLALGQATSVGGAELNGGSSSLSVADRKRANRSSVANLEAMWSTHLQTLWKRVEGSQKYLPALPGRHIIMESQRWVELNAATWKPRRRVALVLLNDHLLIASEKKRKDLIQNDTKSKRQSAAFTTPAGAPGGSQTTFVADRCWPLQDVSLADISAAPTPSDSTSRDNKNRNISNAINIRAGPDSFTYATSDGGEKAGLLVAFRKAQEDLRKAVAAEHVERQGQLDELTLLVGGVRDPRLLKKAAAAAPEDTSNGNAGGLSRSNSVLVDAEGRQQSIRAVEAQIDALDIDIALQRFEDAVARTEKLRKLGRSVRSNAAASEIILAKVGERASRLAALIARQLGFASGGMEGTKLNVSWLLRLGFEEMARARYLDARTETIRVRTRQLPFTGALPPYLHAFAYTTFNLLLFTFRTFAASFPASSGSAVVKWAKERVDEFNVQVERQMASVDRGSALWRECVDVVQERAGVLKEVGVDFRGLVAEGLELGAWREWGGSAEGDGKGTVGLGVST